MPDQFNKRVSIDVKFDDSFRKFSKRMSGWVATPIAFFGALSIVLLWFLTGFYFRFSEAHSDFINTLTNIITFLMVFLIESSQNRDTKAIQLKLNELIKIQAKADKALLNIEEAPEKEFKQVEKVKKKKGRPKKFIAGKTTGESGVS